MPKPNASPAALEIYEALEPAFSKDDPDRNWLALRMCMALVAGRLDLLHRYLIDDIDNLPAWAILFDPERCPAEALPYLSQFSGAILTPEMDEAARRAAIQVPEAFSRGRPESLRAVARRRLTGTKAVVLTERYTNNAWRLRIETLEAETPDPEGTRADIVAYQKPIGIRLFFNTRAAWTWGEVKAQSANFPDWASVKAAFPSWLAFRTHEP
jgi:hypothetical protein